MADDSPPVLWVGACRYVPAEVLNDDLRALDKADVFMLGATLYELASGVALEPSAAPHTPHMRRAAALLPRMHAACHLQLPAGRLDVRPSRMYNDLVRYAARGRLPATSPPSVLIYAGRMEVRWPAGGD